MPFQGEQMETLTIKTDRREQFVAVTAKIEELIGRNGWKDGLLHVHCPHTTAGLTVNENADPDVVRDMLVTLARLVPQRGDYRHSEGNSDAHVKASLMGTGLTLMVEGGEIRLGTWQGVFFCEFDGPRTRQVWVRWMGA
jgi:secondary thiamine-phosphate synthase enzyme